MEKFSERGPSLVFGGVVNALNRIVEAISRDPAYTISSTITCSENETPTGTINGSNDDFTLAHTPDPAGSLQVYLNGMFQTAGGEDYTLAGDTITFVNAPLTNSILRVFYKY